MVLLLDLDLGDQQGGGDGGNRYLAGFGAAITVENVELVGSHQNLRKAGEWSADDINSPHQLIGMSVRIHAINNQGNHGVGLQAAPLGECIAAGHLLEI